MKDTSIYFHWLFHANFVDNAIKGSVQAIFGLNRTKIDCDAVYCHYSYPSKVLQEVEANVTVGRALGVLFIYAVCSRIITFVFIKYRLKTWNSNCADSLSTYFSPVLTVVVFSNVIRFGTHVSLTFQCVVRRPHRSCEIFNSSTRNATQSMHSTM